MLFLARNTNFYCIYFFTGQAVEMNSFTGLTQRQLSEWDFHQEKKTSFTARYKGKSSHGTRSSNRPCTMGLSCDMMSAENRGIANSTPPWAKDGPRSKDRIHPRLGWEPRCALLFLLSHACRRAHTRWCLILLIFSIHVTAASPVKHHIATQMVCPDQSLRSLLETHALVPPCHVLAPVPLCEPLWLASSCLLGTASARSESRITFQWLVASTNADHCPP